MSGLDRDWKDTGLVYSYFTPLTPIGPAQPQPPPSPQPAPSPQPGPHPEPNPTPPPQPEAPVPEPDFFHKNLIPFSIVISIVGLVLFTLMGYYCFYRKPDDKSSSTTEPATIGMLCFEPLRHYVIACELILKVLLL